ncbi:uncharacterized protein LOC108040989 [Drosophila rhopaloa]|uniref:Uncharacterized protein n=1 Tax=Drosophila rhopaloa TaxID=1041015 RepID=A0ABM5H465_DRORH|nr:uncharacterized protein LOC108040989 [Drosophila rhopaloa]
MKKFCDESLVAHQIKKIHLYNNLRILLERCEDFPKRTQSDDSLTRIYKSSQVLDASCSDMMTSRSDIRRLPAGGACSCRSISGRSVPVPVDFRDNGIDIVSESTQTVSNQDMATQTAIPTYSNEQKLDCKFSRDASTQSVPNLRDAETQSTSDSSEALKNIQTQTEIIAQEDPPKSKAPTTDKPEYLDEKASRSDSSFRKCFFRRPIIVVKKGSLITPEFTNKIHQGAPILVTSHKEDKQTQYENPFRQDSNQFDDKSSEPAACIKILDRVEELETKLRRQEQSLKDLQGSVKSWKAQGSKPADCRLIFQAQPKNCELPSKPATSDKASQKKDDNECECNNFSKEFIQIFLKPDSEFQTNVSNTACGGTLRNNTQKPTARQCSWDNDANRRMRTPKPSAIQSCKDDKDERTMKTDRKAIATQCDLNNNDNNPGGRNNIQKPFSRQCLEDTDNILQQFNRAFAPPKSQESICGPSRKTSETNKIQRPRLPHCVTLANQNLKQEEVGNLLDKFVELVTKPDDDTSPARKVSSASCLNKNKSPNQSQSNQTVEKEVYQSLIEQFIHLFTKSKKCETKQAQKTESESYSFDKLLTELIKYFTTPNALESSTCKEEERLKKVTISERETVLGNEQKTKCNCSKEQRNFKTASTQSDLKMSDMHLDLRSRDERPCNVGGKSTISQMYASNMSIRDIKPRDPEPCGCQFCGDGHLPVLDSFLNELFNLIGPRSFNDVVLTILRHPESVYHINVREMASGTVLGCLLANGKAINEAIALGLFEDIHTFCELDKHREHDPRDCPLGSNLDALCPRERGGDIHPDSNASKVRAIEFTTRVLGLPAGQAGRFFSLTNALKLAKNSSHQSYNCSELSMLSLQLRRNPERRVRIGRGAATGNLVYLRSEDSFSFTNFSEVNQTSSLFLRIVSGEDQEVKEKESKLIKYTDT